MIAVLVLCFLLFSLFSVFVAPERASAATYRVTMKGYAYSPGTLTVDVGSTVTWTNQDTAPHDVKTTSGPASIHSPMLNKGQSWSFTFTVAGTYGYYCTVHPDMAARIVVRSAAPATSAAPTAHDHSGSSGNSGTSGSSGGQQETVPGGATTTPRTSGRTPARTTPSSAPPPTTAVASTPPAGAVDPAPATTAPQTQATVSAARPLDPLLVLAGLVSGIAVLCLLLVGSRAAAAREGDTD